MILLEILVETDVFNFVCVCVCERERERERNDFIYGALYEFFTFSLWLLILKNILVFCAEVRYNVCVVVLMTTTSKIAQNKCFD